jgi:endonuclease/exonuclease/phosphatase family metal-dependent hydrolase
MVKNFARRAFIQGIGATATAAVLGSGIGSASDSESTQFSNRPATFDACSFNIRYDNPEDEYPWDERLSRVAQTITDLKPDLLGIQEALPNQYDDLQRTLDDYNWYGVGRRDGNREGEMVPVAWRKSQFELVEKGEFWLSETPDEPSVGWDADLPRVTTWASLQHNETKRRVWLCNTHFSHIGETARIESAKLLREQAQKRAADNEDVVMTGDFNVKPSRKPYQIITGTANDSESRLFDPRREADTGSVSGPWGTYHGFTSEIDDRIDYIFTLDTATVDHYRTLDIRKGAYRSDHLPVMTEFEYSARRNPPRGRGDD